MKTCLKKKKISDSPSLSFPPSQDDFHRAGSVDFLPINIQALPRKGERRFSTSPPAAGCGGPRSAQFAPSFGPVWPRLTLRRPAGHCNYSRSETLRLNSAPLVCSDEKEEEEDDEGLGAELVGGASCGLFSNGLSLTLTAVSLNPHN